MNWDELRARLHAVPSMAGDANKGARVAWMAQALGFTERPANLWLAFERASAEQRAHVDDLLCALERAELGLLA